MENFSWEDFYDVQIVLNIFFVPHYVFNLYHSACQTVSLFLIYLPVSIIRLWAF